MSSRLNGARLLLAALLSACWWPHPDELPSPAPDGETPTPSATGTPEPTGAPSPTEPPEETPPLEPCLDLISQAGPASDDCRTTDAASALELAPEDGPVRVEAAGDLDGDGLDELVIIVEGLDEGGDVDAGGVFLYYGSPAGIDLSAPDALLAGAAAGDGVRHARGGGDVNGDGYGDLLIGAPSAQPDNQQLAGELYLICGGPDRLEGTHRLHDEVTAVVIEGKAEVELGTSVALVARFNGDPYADLVMTATHTSIGHGHVHIVFGAPDLCDGPRTLDLNDSTDVELRVKREKPENLGAALASPGDVDGDGFEDLLVGAPGRDSSITGSAYLIYGDDYPPGMLLELFNPNNNLVEFVGERNGDQLGYALAGGGDLDGNGQPDLVMGAPGFDGEGSDTGALYLVGGLNRETGLRTLEIEKVAHRVVEPTPGAGLGRALALVPDVDGNELAEMLAGAPDAQGGIAWLFLGLEGRPAARTVRFENDPSRVGLGISVATADVEGSSLPELFIVAGGDGTTRGGAVYHYHMLE